MTDEKGLYARAHDKIINLLPSLKGETLSREDFWKLLNIRHIADHQDFKKAINDVLWNLSERNQNKLIKKVGNRFKIVDDKLTELKWQKADPKQIVPIILPFGIHELCVMYRKNIMIISGSKDSGKTATMLNIIRENMATHKITYFNSEMGEVELLNRIKKFDGISPEEWNFECFERSYDFEDVIDPDGMNLIDFLELGGDDQEYYKVVAYIRRIYDKLNQGIAIIALQKNVGATYPRGGQGAFEKARIVLTLDSGKATLSVAKNWAEGVVENPRNRAWTYKLVGGVNIRDVLEWTE
mgnify:CR=1 FL=1